MYLLDSVIRKGVIYPLNCFYSHDLISLNFNEIASFEDEGRVISVEDLPKIEDILGISSGVLS
jgi:aconitate hydratase 2/2-methylisocitrate dehydratase